MEQVMAGGDKRRSGASSHTLMVSDLDGALEIRRLMCDDGLAQEVEAVWRRGGVGGS